jgi:N-acyl-D-aspartate/D-glutamate deacylase
MTTFQLLTILLISAFFPAHPHQNSSFPPPLGPYDYAIVGGIVIDGTGSPGFRADLLIKDGQIQFIGTVDTSSLLDAEIIDATDKVICPGFIDAHAHGDPRQDDFENFVAMGVTTILLGQDGESLVNGIEYPTASSFFTQIKSIPKLVNMAFLAGHGSIRKKASLAVESNLDISNIAKLETILEENLREGCYGISTGLEYLPGSLAGQNELVALAKVVGKNNKLMMSHLRSEDDDHMNNSLFELISLGTYCKIHVSHIKVVYGKDSARAVEIIRNLEGVRRSGIKISADVYPYMASYTGIGIVFPSWAKSKHDFDLAKIHRREELEAFLKQKIMSRNGPEATLFASRPFVGMTLAEVSKESGKDFVEILMTLGPQGASGAYFVMNEGLQECFILDRSIAIASDGGPTLRHPRSYGTFAKLISKYVVQEKKLSLELAVQKASAIPAKLIGLSERGEIRKGYHADLLIFDPGLIKDLATFSNPFSLAKGFDTVMIDGKIVRSQGKIVCHNCGELLLSPKGK